MSRDAGDVIMIMTVGMDQTRIHVVSGGKREGGEGRGVREGRGERVRTKGGRAGDFYVVWLRLRSCSLPVISLRLTIMMTWIFISVRQSKVVL